MRLWPLTFLVIALGLGVMYAFQKIATAPASSLNKAQCKEQKDKVARDFCAELGL